MRTKPNRKLEVGTLHIVQLTHRQERKKRTRLSNAGAEVK